MFKLRSLQGTSHIHITMFCLYLAAQALNVYFVLIRVISTKDDRIDDLMRAHLVYNVPAASLSSADNCNLIPERQRKVQFHLWALRREYSLLHTRGVPNPILSSEKLQITQYLETFCFLLLWVVRVRSLLALVPSMLCGSVSSAMAHSSRQATLNGESTLNWKLVIHSMNTQGQA